MQLNGRTTAFLTTIFLVYFHRLNAEFFPPLRYPYPHNLDPRQRNKRKSKYIRIHNLALMLFSQVGPARSSDYQCKRTIHHRALPLSLSLERDTERPVARARVAILETIKPSTANREGNKNRGSFARQRHACQTHATCIVSRACANCSVMSRGS